MGENVVRSSPEASPKDLQREYLRAWRKRNPEKVKQYNREYWQRKAEKKRKENSRGES